MTSAWKILIILTLTRMTMGFQFQSIAALGDWLTVTGLSGEAELGLLIGIYLLPGAFLAVPGAWLGCRFGEKRIVMIGLVMMIVGGMVSVFIEEYRVLLAARLLSGIGAILLNIMISKMVTDWFAQKQLATAMGLVISSWPLGIGLAMVITQPVVLLVNIEVALLLPPMLCITALLALVKHYPSDNVETQIQKNLQKGSYSIMPIGLSRYETTGVVLSGLIWCFYNVALILPLSFGSGLLISKGVNPVEANMTVSLVSWIIIPALPLGAWVADKLGQPVQVMMVSFCIIASLLFLLPMTSTPIFLCLLLGLAFGPAGGLIMALPGQILSLGNRAAGFGLFWTIYYIGMAVFPALGGYLNQLTTNPHSPIYLAGIMILLNLPLLILQRVLFHKKQRDTFRLKVASV